MAVSAVLVACGQLYQADPLGSLREWSGVKAAVGKPAGRGATLVVTPQFVTPKLRVQTAINAFGRSDIARLRIELVDASDSAILAMVELTNSQLDNPIEFTGLAAMTTYKIVTRAFDAQDALISDEIASTTEVSIGADPDIQYITIRVRLIDRDFSATGSSNIEIIEGGYTSSESASMSVSPTPEPTPSATPDPTPTP